LKPKPGMLQVQVERRGCGSAVGQLPREVMQMLP
jgi:hypothetical protein